MPNSWLKIRLARFRRSKCLSSNSRKRQRRMSLSRRSLIRKNLTRTRKERGKIKVQKMYRKMITKKMRKKLRKRKTRRKIRRIKRKDCQISWTMTKSSKLMKKTSSQLKKHPPQKQLVKKIKIKIKLKSKSLKTKRMLWSKKFLIRPTMSKTM